MQTKNGISVDVINAATGLKPLDLLLDNGITLVRLPHGQFKVRVHTPHATEVEVQLDEVELAKVQVPAGMNTIERDSKGAFFAFNPATASNTTPAIAQEVEMPEGEPVEGEPTADEKPLPAAERLGQPTGFLAISVRFVEQPPVPGVVPPPSNTEDVLFKLNEPKEHARITAANFHKIVSPEPLTRPWCSCCKHG